MEQTQSWNQKVVNTFCAIIKSTPLVTWYGEGVLDITENLTAPQWQLPLSSTGIFKDLRGGVWLGNCRIPSVLYFDFDLDQKK
jgi:hypothetical protein